MKNIFIRLFPHTQTKKPPNHKNPMSYMLSKCLINQFLQALQGRSFCYLQLIVFADVWNWLLCFWRHLEYLMICSRVLQFAKAAAVGGLVGVSYKAFNEKWRIWSFMNRILKGWWGKVFKEVWAGACFEVDFRLKYNVWTVLISWGIDQICL